jgi:PKD repeat protein
MISLLQKILTCFVFFVFLVLSANAASADVIIDNGAAGTSSTGTWALSGGTAPYGATSLWSRNEATYTFSMTGQVPGTYEVLMWWSGYYSRASSVPLTIYYSGGIQNLTVNQQQNSGRWNSLGTFYFDGSGSVMITAANGDSLSTCADAVQFRHVSSNIAPTAIIDSINPSPANPGEIVTFTGHGTDTDGTITAYEWSSSRDGVIGSSESFTTSSLSTGTHTISFRVSDDGGLWSTAATTQLVVGTPSVELIIDNGDTGTSSTGSWGFSGGTDPYGATSVWSRNGSTYTYTMTGQPSGTYEVSMWWSGYSSRATSVPITITYTGGTSNMTVNQRTNPGQWNSLGTFYFDGTGSVRITAATGDTLSTCADAVKFSLKSSNLPPSAVIDSIDPNPAELGQSITFTGHGTDPDGTIAAYEWTSSRDGIIGTAASFSTTTLTAGTHDITFRVRDNLNVWSTPVTSPLIIQSSNSQPVSFIDSITPNPANAQDPVTFTGHGTDSDGTITGYEWTSSRDGVIGTTASFTISTLTAGTHSISFKVKDDKESWSVAVETSLVILGPNAEPVATIDSVTPNPSNAGQSVTFTGHGTDSDGTITGYEWTSSRDGIIGTAASFSSTVLTVGTHTITFRVKDDRDAWSVPAQASLTVMDAPPAQDIIDNTDTRTSSTGTWLSSAASGYYGTNSVWARDGATFSWLFTPTSSGYFEVFMWWTTTSTRSPSIPVTITHAGGSQTVTINQLEKASQWNSLGTYQFLAGTTYRVTIVSQAGPTSTCADAVKFEPSILSAPVPDFTADVTWGFPPLTVHFTDKTKGIVTSLLWSFGDGSTSIEKDPSHTYTQVGTYTVSLTATNDAGSGIATKSQYIRVDTTGENIYLSDGYSSDALFIPRANDLLKNMGAQNVNGTWTYTNSNTGKRYFIHTIKDPVALATALKEDGAHIIFNGHANFGLGATFATVNETYSQEITAIRYIDDDRFTNFSSDMVSVKIDGVQYGQAYPNWLPIFKDGTSGIMPYTFSQGLPPYNYYITYKVPGDPTLYRVELEDGKYLERFPDSATPAWYSPVSAAPDPSVNPEYFIVNNDIDYNRCDFTGTWPIEKIPGGGYMGKEGYLGYNYQYHAAGTGANKATWTLIVNYPGMYAALASWRADTRNASNAKFTVNHAGGSTVVEMDQRVSEFTNPLGVYYFDTGVYTVTLTDNANARVVADAVVLSAIANPQKIFQAEFDADLQSGNSPLAVQFTDLSGYYNMADATSSITQWRWEFGDGTISTQQNPAHTYSSPGIYTVSLTATDSTGATDTETKTGFVVVGQTAPVRAQFTSASRMGSDRTVVKFTDQSTGNIDSWLWDFGDGTTSTEQDPTHVYSVPGAYAVSLTVSGPGGSHTETEADFVNNIIGIIYADNTAHHRPHFYSRLPGSPITFGKVILDTKTVKIPDEDLRYSRMFYGSCNSCSYYAGTFQRGIMFCTSGDSNSYTGLDYLQRYLMGYTDEQLLTYVNAIQPIHHILNFNLAPPSMR